MLVTALVTPFAESGAALDVATFARLAAFQLDQGVDMLLVGGTTGEGAALSEAERETLLDAVLEVAEPAAVMVALGAGRTDDLVARGRSALERGIRHLLLADCPYVGASSAALREAWYGPVAGALPESKLFPYVVPGRTGTALLPEDLARLAEDHACIAGVKDATGTLSSKRRVRELCGDRLAVLCGDDHLLLSGLTDATVRIDGAVTFGANLAPRLYAEVLARHEVEASEQTDALAHVAALVSIDADESLRVNGRDLSVSQRYRNPLPVKAAFELLGAASSACRAPLAPMGPAGSATLRAAIEALVVHPARPLAPLQAFVERDAPARATRPAKLPS